jgi:hypothetical protein
LHLVEHAAEEGTIGARERWRTVGTEQSSRVLELEAEGRKRTGEAGKCRVDRLQGCCDFALIGFAGCNRLRVLPERQRQRSPAVGPRSDVSRRRDNRRLPFDEMRRHRELPLQRLEPRVTKVTRPHLRHHRSRGEVHDRVVRVLENTRPLNAEPELLSNIDSRLNRQPPPLLRRHAPDSARLTSVRRGDGSPPQIFLSEQRLSDLPAQVSTARGLGTAMAYYAFIFSPDRQTLIGNWEKSSDGSTWEHDFDLTYTKEYATPAD